MSRDGDRVRIVIEGVVDGDGPVCVPVDGSVIRLTREAVATCEVLEQRYDPKPGDVVSWAEGTGTVVEVGSGSSWFQLAVRVQPSDRRCRPVIATAPRLTPVAPTRNEK